MKRICMFVLFVSALCGGNVRAQVTRTAITHVIGVYADDGSGPLDSVYIVETNYSIGMLTGKTGTAFLTLYKGEMAKVLLRKVGYDSLTVDVPFEMTGSTTVTMHRSATSLPTVVTNESAMRTEMAERVRIFGGKMISPEELKKPEYQFLDMGHALLKNGIRLSDATNNRGSIGGALSGRQCFARILVDDEPAIGQVLSDQAQRFTAAEFYPDALRTPEQFASPHNGSCGVLVLWTSVSVYHASR